MHIPIPGITRAPDHWQNLLWAVGTPSIMNNPQLPWLPADRQRVLLEYFSDPLTIGKLSDPLEHFLSQKPRFRLGIYFEDLWEFAFTHHPDYHLLRRNLPLRNNKLTLGELDFIVEYLPEKTTEHWEIAVKFYLQADAYWVGPGLRDRLDLKLARMRQHQIPIALQPIPVEILRRENISLDAQYAVMPGRIFRPHAESGGPWPVAEYFNDRALRNNWWSDQQSLLSTIKDGNSVFAVLAKPCWLSVNPPAHKTYTLDKLLEIIQQENISEPICICEFGQTGEVSRGFIVPDDWIDQARERCVPAKKY